MTSANALLFIALSFIGGIFVSCFIDVPQIIVYELLILGIFYAWLALTRYGMAFLGMMKTFKATPQVTT